MLDIIPIVLLLLLASNLLMVGFENIVSW